MQCASEMEQVQAKQLVTEAPRSKLRRNNQDKSDFDDDYNEYGVPCIKMKKKNQNARLRIYLQNSN